MPKYSIMLEGENFPLNLDGSGTHLFGFVTTRIVKADNVDLAKAAALKLINDDNLLNNKSNAQDTIPSKKITITEIRKANWWNRTGGKGYSFFLMDENDD